MEHYPVLLNECIEGLNIRPDGIYLDGTLGRGGHSERILAAGGRLIAIDRDAQAIEETGRRLAQYAGRFTLVRGNFGDLASILAEQGIERVDGMLFDLGVSSPQLDDAERGFSYMNDAPLDMRMDRRQPLTAADVVNTWPESELTRILFDYGEEKFARRIAENIVRTRTERLIETTAELSDIVRAAMPAAAMRGEKQHPAKRTFQAIRIAVNDELGEIERMLGSFLPCLSVGGRICVITFHSLEDRPVKTAFAELAKGCTCPPNFPVCVCGKKPELKLITKKPVTASEKELNENPRSRSAKLRIAEKL